MRITGGQERGRLLSTPKGRGIRPTSDQVRAAIFNIIGQDLNGLRVLDLFAGTGSLGLEALSRGAAEAIFVDKAMQSINLIKKNLSLCGFEESGVIFKRDLGNGIPKILFPADYLFDLVFIDPPYRKGLLPEIMKDLATCDILSSPALIVAEHYKKEEIAEKYGCLENSAIRKYGDTIISIYTKEERK